ncbi:fatty acyl-AMP ligase [Streptomyces malaysiensis]|uniref:fatty acyl-AMP ligase n=1 Tax=Streptomyces malaysiensis TaxID=92644 RepID=UPI0032200835|nr:fatty acyl-AMP ligase [Streptomyces malaysiensis]
MTSVGHAPEKLMSLPALLARRAAENPDGLAYCYLRNGEDPDDRVTYAELRRQALVRAAELRRRDMRGRGAVLMYPTGLEFVRAWLGCTAAGVMGAPVQVPRNGQALRRLRSVADDSGTTWVLTTAETRDRLLADFPGAPELRGLELLATDEFPEAATAEEPLPAAGPDDVALLQYTSGSTGTPKGVMVTHRNFWHNAAETDALWPTRGGTVVSWLPLFHDMGLLFGVVLPLWAGIPSYLMGPEAFVRRPARWLEALSRFRGTHAAAPNFAYDLCVREAPPAPGCDLSAWRAAVNGAEPVRLHTVRAFIEAFTPYGLDPRAVSPGYGLAEHTLKISGSGPGEPPRALTLSPADLGEGRVTETTDTAAVPVVSCGRTIGGTRVRIVDPATGRAAAPDRVGEIWATGPCVAAGYAGRERESEETFRARIADDADTAAFLRTGDIGFVRDGELYVTGRLKDLLVVKGRNHYPQDLEYSAERSHPALRPASAAAFAVDRGDREALVVVIEADGRALRAAGHDVLVSAVRERVRSDHRLEAEDIVVIRRGTLPKTTSGKVRRGTCRQQYVDGTLVRVGGGPA